MSAATSEPALDATFGITVEEAHSTRDVAPNLAIEAVDEDSKAPDAPDASHAAGLDAVVVIPLPSGGAAESKDLPPSGAPRSRSGTEASEWQFSLERLKSHKVDTHSHTSPRVRHFYKRQNEIIDNLIAWHDDVKKGTEQSQDQQGARH